jgi:hypothetical protein
MGFERSSAQNLLSSGNSGPCSLSGLIASLAPITKGRVGQCEFPGRSALRIGDDPQLPGPTNSISEILPPCRAARDARRSGWRTAGRN